jgi:uncharacterized protein YecE (DUF72 family)
MIRVGISGWAYPSWRGLFYPPGLPARRQLAYASRRFTSIEVNATFYRLQTPATFTRWREAVPPGFIFAVKGGQYITHMRRLADAERGLANFFASGVLALGDALGPILWQLPERRAYDPEAIDRFLALLPRDLDGAAALARRRHFPRPREVFLEIGANRPLRHALEVRHQSYAVPDFARRLRRAGVALAVSDAPDWPRFEELTADFLYIRLHGATDLYASGYGPRALAGWARRIALWAAGGEPSDARRIDPREAPAERERNVYVYFDNDARARAPADAQALMRELHLQPIELGGKASTPERKRC